MPVSECAMFDGLLLCFLPLFLMFFRLSIVSECDFCCLDRVLSKSNFVFSFDVELLILVVLPSVSFPFCDGMLQCVLY